MKSTRIVFVLLSACLATFVIGLGGCASKGTDYDNDVSAEASGLGNNPLIPKSWGPNYKYNELMTKDYDEMLAMVQSLVKKARAATAKTDGSTGGDGEAVEYLGRALKLIFSRPDSDNMVAKLTGEVRRDLQGFNSYEDAVFGIASEAVRIAKNTDNAVIAQSTALVEIENILAEIRPEVQNGNPGMRRVMQSIRDTNLDMSDEVKRDRRLRGMFKTKNPSDEARDILRAIDKAKKKR